MDQRYLQLMEELYCLVERQGPGSPEAMDQAISLMGLSFDRPLKIADIGCGTGASVIRWAEQNQTQITAVDFLLKFLQELQSKVDSLKLNDRVECIQVSMQELPFKKDSFDIIWSEGAIYNIGFTNGIKAWRSFLKKSGYLAVSEITWFTDKRPRELEEYWNAMYSEIDTASQKIKVLEKNGYKVVGYFPLPDNCWTENFYQPLKVALHRFLKTRSNDELAQQIAEENHQEMRLFDSFREYYGYGMYIAQKL